MEKFATRDRRYVPGGGIRTGDRVELHPAVHSRGVRCGNVVKLGGEMVYVRLDRTGAIQRFLAEELIPLL